MACFHPIPALQDGARVILHPRPLGSENLRLPCGRCIGCKTARSQEWATRCVHELREHHNAIFATLTYDDAHLPADGSLVPEHLTLFLKRLRKTVADSADTWISGNGPEYFYAKRLRYLACGEYGELRGRPHYHAILFGITCNDANRATNILFNSPELEWLWGHGTVNYGEVTRASAAYVAGYSVKSLGRPNCDSDGVVVVPPFLRVSQGLGKRYVDKYATDFRNGCVVVDGTPQRLPRYYKKRLEALRPDIAEDATMAQCAIERDPKANSEAHLRAGEVIMKRRRELSHLPTF